MIPKIIHRFWGSKDGNLPNKESEIGKWFYSQDILQDYGYEIKTYTCDNFDMAISNYLLQAYALKKWAFVSDYIRLYVLYNEGGIWVDTDVEVFKPFDDLLDQKYFFSAEYNMVNNSKEVFNPVNIQDWGVLGVESYNPIIKQMLDYYNSINFIDPDYYIHDKIQVSLQGKQEDTINMNYENILKQMNIKKQIVSTSLLDYKNLVNTQSDNIIYLLNTKWLTYVYYNDKNKDDDIICVHHRNGSWINSSQYLNYLYEYSPIQILSYFIKYKEYINKNKELLK